MRLGVCSELVQHSLTIGIDRRLVGHGVFHADPAVLSDIAAGDLLLIEELDQEGPRGVEHFGRQGGQFSMSPEI